MLEIFLLIGLFASISWILFELLNKRVRKIQQKRKYNKMQRRTSISNTRVLDVVPKINISDVDFRKKGKPLTPEMKKAILMGTLVFGALLVSKRNKK